MVIQNIFVDPLINNTSDGRRLGIDASGFNRSHASKHYTKRAELTIQQLKMVLLVDAKENAIPNLHVKTTRKHDSQIVPSLIKYNSREYRDSAR